jgi:galactokinase/mevalonate kinase-like predicted kinase
MLLIYTGGVHLSETIHEDIKRSYAMQNSPTIAAMDALKATAYSMADALEGGNFNGFVDALNTSRRNHYALHSSCDSDALRAYFDRLEPYILGGKACGAGGGRFMAVVTKPGHKQNCIDAAEALGGTGWPLKIDHDGAVAWQEDDWTTAELRDLTSLARAGGSRA